MKIDHEEPWVEIQFVMALMTRGFVRQGHATLMYRDQRDVITVFIGIECVIIMGDAHVAVPNQVVKSWNMIQRREGSDTFFWEGIYQEVVAKF